MTDMRTLRFYVTPEHDCSYLPQHRARTLFVDPQARIDDDSYTQLSELGFRRSGSHIYRPHCDGCRACISVRLPVHSFQRNSAQRRTWHRNHDLSVSQVRPQLTDEYYNLYARYIEARHADGDMYPPTPSQFHNFLVEGHQQTSFFTFRDPKDKLLCIAVTDCLGNGLSALYTFYDPTQSQRSLGTYAILWQIEETRRRQLPHLYLGYWVKACRKMKYKAGFQPLEMLIDGHWSRLLQDSF